MAPSPLLIAICDHSCHLANLLKKNLFSFIKIFRTNSIGLIQKVPCGTRVLTFFDRVLSHNFDYSYNVVEFCIYFGLDVNYTIWLLQLIGKFSLGFLISFYFLLTQIMYLSAVPMIFTSHASELEAYNHFWETNSTVLAQESLDAMHESGLIVYPINSCIAYCLHRICLFFGLKMSLSMYTWATLSAASSLLFAPVAEECFKRSKYVMPPLMRTILFIILECSQKYRGSFPYIGMAATITVHTLLYFIPIKTGMFVHTMWNLIAIIVSDQLSTTTLPMDFTPVAQWALWVPALLNHVVFTSLGILLPHYYLQNMCHECLSVGMGCTPGKICYCSVRFPMSITLKTTRFGPDKKKNQHIERADRKHQENADARKLRRRQSHIEASRKHITEKSWSQDQEFREFLKTPEPKPNGSIIHRTAVNFRGHNDVEAYENIYADDERFNQQMSLEMGPQPNGGYLTVSPIDFDLGDLMTNGIPSEMIDLMATTYLLYTSASQRDMLAVVATLRLYAKACGHTGKDIYHVVAKASKWLEDSFKSQMDDVPMPNGNIDLVTAITELLTSTDSTETTFKSLIKTPLYEKALKVIGFSSLIPLMMMFNTFPTTTVANKWYTEHLVAKLVGLTAIVNVAIFLKEFANTGLPFFMGKISMDEMFKTDDVLTTLIEVDTLCTKDAANQYIVDSYPDGDTYTTIYIEKLMALNGKLRVLISKHAKDSVKVDKLRASLKVLMLYSNPIIAQYHATSPCIPPFYLQLVSGTHCQKGTWKDIIHAVAWRHLFEDKDNIPPLDHTRIINLIMGNDRMDNVNSESLIINIDDHNVSTKEYTDPYNHTGDIMYMKQGTSWNIDKADLPSKGVDYFKPKLITSSSNHKDLGYYLKNANPPAAYRRVNLYCCIKPKNGNKTGHNFNRVLTVAELAEYYYFLLEVPVITEYGKVVFKNIKSKTVNASQTAHKEFIDNGPQDRYDYLDFCKVINDEFERYYAHEQLIVANKMANSASPVCPTGCGYPSIACQCAMGVDRDLSHVVEPTANGFVSYSQDAITFLFSLWISYYALSYFKVWHTMHTKWNNNLRAMALKYSNKYYKYAIYCLPFASPYTKTVIAKQIMSATLADVKTYLTDLYYEGLHLTSQQYRMVLATLGSASVLVLARMLYNSSSSTPDQPLPNHGQIVATTVPQANAIINVVNGRAEEHVTLRTTTRLPYSVKMHPSVFAHTPSTLREKIERDVINQLRWVDIKSRENTSNTCGTGIMVYAGLLLIPYHYVLPFELTSNISITINGKDEGNLGIEQTIQVRTNTFVRVKACLDKSDRDLVLIPIAKNVFGGNSLIKHMLPINPEKSNHMAGVFDVIRLNKDGSILQWAIAGECGSYKDTVTKQKTLGIICRHVEDTPKWGATTCGSILIHRDSGKIASFHIADLYTKEGYFGYSIPLITNDFKDLIDGIPIELKGTVVSLENEMYLNCKDTLTHIGELTPNSRLTHLPKGSYGRILGTCNSFRSKRNASSLEYTALRGVTPVHVKGVIPNMFGWEDEDGAWRDGHIKSLLNNSYAPISIDDDLFEICFKEYTELNWDHIDFSKCKLWTMDQVLNGTEFSKPMNIKAGAGINWTGKKSDYIFRNENGRLEAVPALIMAVERALENNRNGVNNNYVVGAGAKNEIRDEGKEYRIFWNMPIVAVIVNKMYFGAFSELVMNDSKTEHALGINCCNPTEWYNLFCKIRPTENYDSSNPEHDCVLGSDRKMYDMFAKYMVFVRLETTKYIKSHCPMMVVHFTAMVCSVYDYKNIIRCYEGDLILFADTIISGDFITVWWNCIIDSVVHRMTYYTCFILANPVRYESGFWEKVAAVIPKFNKYVVVSNYGDDSILKVRNWIAQGFFTGENIATATAMLGVPTTDCLKRDIIAYDPDLDNLDYLKRSFVMRDGVCYAPLALSSIYKSLTVVNVDSPLSKPDQMKLVVENSVKAMFMHGREAFDGHLKWLDEIAFPLLDKTETYSMVSMYRYPTFEEEQILFMKGLYTDLDA